MSQDAAALAPSISASALVFGIADAAAKLAASPKVYPMYLASRIKSALKQADRELAPGQNIIESVADIETLGDCRYAMTVTDHNGTKYRVTVEVVR